MIIMLYYTPIVLQFQGKILMIYIILQPITFNNLSTIFYFVIKLQSFMLISLFSAFWQNKHKSPSALALRGRHTQNIVMLIIAVKYYVNLICFQQLQEKTAEKNSAVKKILYELRKSVSRVLS